MKKRFRKLFSSTNMEETLRNSKGFTLIELAIVMVIIGIILGAVLKGQDLIAGARGKKFVTWEKSWEVAQWQFFDRKGRFAGDQGKNGIIGDNNAGAGTETTLAKSAIDEILTANFINTPTYSISLGSTSFNALMGSSTSGSIRNVMAICKSATNTAAPCETALTADELVYLEALDTAIDGTSDPMAGNVRSIITGSVGVAGTTYPVVTTVVEGAVATWTTAAMGAVYYFDKPR